MSIRRFPNASFGPMELRPVLRARLSRAERLVGWGVVNLAPRGSFTWFRVALWLIPGVGHIAGLLFRAVADLSNRRLLVLTQRRVLLLRVDGGKRRLARTGPTLDVPVEHLHIVAPDLAHAPNRSSEGGDDPDDNDDDLPSNFSLTLNTVMPEQVIRFELPHGHGDAVERLREALVLLARDEVS